MAYLIPYQIGMDKWEIDTPALLLDLDVMEKNINEMANFVASVGTNLRPHIKNHMSPIVARKQLDAGAVGFCCQSIGEAEIVGSWGIRDILLSNEIVGSTKIRRLMALKNYTDVKVAIDNLENAAQLSQAAMTHDHVLEVFIDLNTGYHRCGVEPVEPALAFAKEVAKMEGLRIAGLNGYSPMHEYDPETRRKRQEEMLKPTVETKELLEKNGITLDTVSAGCTAVYDIAASYPGITEIQPGTYAFMDLNNEELLGTAPADLDYALTILTTVISAPTDDRVVVDVGNKAMGEGNKPLEKETALFRDIEGVQLFRLSAEHGRIRLVNPSRELKVGDKIELTVPYCDGTVNRWTKYYCLKEGRLEAVWDIHHHHQ